MFWTVLIIHYHIEALKTNTLTHIVYSTEKKCSAAMGQMIKLVKKEYPDAWAQCEPTSSPTLRPKPRPAWLEKGTG